MSQRWLTVGAAGAACWAVAYTLNRWLERRSLNGGWFNYAPNNGVSVSWSSGWALRELLVWLIAIGVWYLIGSRVLKRGSEGSTTEGKSL